MCENFTMLLWICLAFLISYCNGLPKPVESTMGKQRKYGSGVTNDYIKQNDGAGRYGQQPPKGNSIGQSGQDTGITALDVGGHETWELPFGSEAGVDPNNVISLGSVDSGSVSTIPNDGIEMPSTIGGILEQYIPPEFANTGTYANDPAANSYSNTNQDGDSIPSKVIEPAKYQQSVDKHKPSEVQDSSVFDITATNFKNGHQLINNLIADQGAVVSPPHLENSNPILSETPIQTEHAKSQNAHSVHTSGTANSDNRNHQHEHHNHGMIRDPKTGDITHIVDPHDGSILPVQHHEFLGGHVIDPHTKELLLALETESFLPTNVPSDSNHESHVSHEQGPTSQNVGNVLDTSQASSPSFQNYLETLHTHEGAGQSFLNEPDNSHQNLKPFVDSGYAESEVLPDSPPKNMVGTDSYGAASSNAGKESYGQDARVPRNNGGGDYTGNSADKTQPVSEVQPINSYGQNTGSHPGDTDGTDYSNNVPLINEPILKSIPEILHDHGSDPLSTNNVLSDYSSQSGTNHEPFVNLPPIETNEQNHFLIPSVNNNDRPVASYDKPEMNPIPDGSYTQDSNPSNGIDSSLIDLLTPDTEKIPEPIPKTMYGQKPEQSPIQPVLSQSPKDVYGGESTLVDISGGDYSGKPSSKTKFALDLLPTGHDIGTNLDKALSSDYTGNSGSNVEPHIEPIPKTSYDQGSKILAADNVADYTGNIGTDIHPNVDPVPVESYEQNPIDPFHTQNFGNDYSDSENSRVHPVIDPLQEEEYTKQQNSYSTDKVVNPYTGEDMSNRGPASKSFSKSSYGKDPNPPLELSANTHYGNNKVLDIAPVENQLAKETYGEKTNSDIIDHTSDLPSNTKAILEQLSGGLFGDEPNSHPDSIIGSYSQTSKTEPIVESVSGSDYTSSKSIDTDAILEPPPLGSYGQVPNLSPPESVSDYTNPESNPVLDVLPEGPYTQDSIPHNLPSYGQKPRPQVVDQLPLKSYGENVPRLTADKISSDYAGAVDPILESKPKRSYGKNRPDIEGTSKQRLDLAELNGPGGIAVHPELLLKDKRHKMYADGSAVSNDVAMIQHDASSGYKDPTSVISGVFPSEVLPNHEGSYLAENGKTGEVRSLKPVSRKYTRGSSISRTKPVRGSKIAKRKSASYGSRLLQKASRGSRKIVKSLKKYASKTKTMSKRRRRRKLREQRRKRKQMLRKKKQERRKKRILAAKAKRQRAAQQKTKTTRKRKNSRRRKTSRVQTKNSSNRRTYENTQRTNRNRRIRRSCDDDDDKNDD